MSSEYARDDAQFGEKNVLEHARVVSVCFRSGTVLPFRFELFSIPTTRFARLCEPIAGHSVKALPAFAARLRCT